MKAYEAIVGVGTRVHAVVLTGEELPSRNVRRDLVYRTACGEHVRGSSIYTTRFGRKDGGIDPCGTCVRYLRKREERQP